MCAVLQVVYRRSLRGSVAQLTISSSLQWFEAAEANIYSEEGQNLASTPTLLQQTTKEGCFHLNKGSWKSMDN